MVEERFEIFLVAAPGLEQALRDECLTKGFSAPKVTTGGVTFQGRWREVWRANLELRGAGAVLLRMGTFPAQHLSELDKSAKAFPWGKFLHQAVALRVVASCSASDIYHSGAVEQRIIAALDGFIVQDDAHVAVLARIHKNICTLSLDTSGEPLHKRGHKEAMAKAPIRETMAALFLQMCNYKGDETVLDPMCGSGTFLIEAAEMAMGLTPGRGRSFAFEQLKSFHASQWQALRSKHEAKSTPHQFLGFDRDAGAIKASAANALRAGVSSATQFKLQTLSELQRPDSVPGLVITNPPYGARIGDKGKLTALYQTFGRIMRERFTGWRVGLVTDSPSLAKATGLQFMGSEPVLHGGIRVRLYQTDRL